MLFRLEICRCKSKKNCGIGPFVFKQVLNKMNMLFVKYQIFIVLNRGGGKLNKAKQKGYIV